MPYSLEGLATFETVEWVRDIFLSFTKDKNMGVWVEAYGDKSP
jgi:hypothetical protein